MSQHRLDALQRHAGSLLLLMALVLMPWGRSAELPVLLAALLGLRELPRLKLDPDTRPLLVAFLAYWLPELMSAPDAVEPVKAWTEVFADLRFLPLLLFAHAQLRSAPTLRRVLGCSAAVLAVWLLDALLQASTGFSLGGSNLTDRLSGIFGDDNLKLGGVLATLSPLLLWQARNLGGRKWLLGAALLCLWVVLLAGARAAWLVYGLVLIALLWRELGGGRRALIGMGVAAVLGLSSGLAMWQLSPRFAERVDRTTAALQGDTAALDHALSFRLPIWRTALCLIEQHPWNGVGVRGFRHAYPDCAAADDRFLDRTQDIGALHAHQWVLEVLSETGMLGLSCWCIGIGWLARWHHRRDPQQRTDVFPVSVALLVLMFPLNTHYALYSSFHGLLLFWLLALWLAPTSTAQTT
ncbi:MAG: O-antigen ligase family protein [Xanthomonadales bacterium]|nr:O-antigen ligase family protein [Xanthomonadales bacterium]